MVKSELYSNLKQAIDMLDGLLIPEGSKELSYWGSEEDELNLLQEEISALDYSCLDEVYHGGLKEVINDNLSPAENALISGVGLLDEYGLSEEEFREWLEKQPEVYSLLLGILITGKWPDYSQWKKMEDYFEEEYRQELFDPANINISPKSGIRFAEEKPEDGSQSFYYLQKVIVFDKSFDAYNGVARELKPILQEARKFYLDKQAEALNNPGACGDHFYETMLTFAQAFKEAQESILRATTSGLRRRSVKADVIQNFRLKYREIAQESCRDFLHVFEHMIELYEQFYPEKEQGRHEYIDYISALRSGQRNLEIAVSDLSQFQKNALYTANKAATSAVNRFANSFMDSAHASKEQRAFAEKLKAVFDTEQYERAIDMIFRAFGDNVDIEYTDSLGIETDILVSAQQEKNICEELVDIFDQGSIDKNTIAEFLKTYTMQYPYDANLYAIAYLYFGSGAGDLEDITKYLGIYDSFVDCAKEICIFKLKYQMNLDMEGNNLEQLEADVQFAKRLVKKYALLQTELEPYAIRMQSELGGKKYTATHPKEETQCFYKIMADKQLTKGDALYLKGSEEFEKYYAKYEMEEANQQVQYQIYANKMLSYLKKNASAKEQFDTAVRFAIQYDVVDENNNVVTSYEPKIKFTMSLLANLELKIIFGTVPDALECHSYEEAVEHRNQFYEIVKKYSLGEVTGNQCVLNKMYDDMFAQKGSYAFYIQWLNNEFPSEVEYQKKLQETKGLKKILVMATKPNHLATIE